MILTQCIVINLIFSFCATVTDATVNFDEVAYDIHKLLKDSKEWWPADFGTYAPFFIRLAWHSAGTYRSSDGRGGGEGGRQRFEPERSWDDNTNLDKARRLLWPVKRKYGSSLSWGDLYILAGNTAIESMGGKVLGFCGGRIDDADGKDSLLLGPTPEQEIYYPCIKNGDCKGGLGSNTLGLIYVNPGGHLGVPEPMRSAQDIRDTFGRMNMNDTETVALIGGGHAVGKAHGACPAGAGAKPKEDPRNPWPGLCGTGKGEDVSTSGYELPFTSKPTIHDNEYFINLLKYEWKLIKGSGNKNQWSPVPGAGEDVPKAPSASGKFQQSVGMLTTDIALKTDQKYRRIVEQFAEDPDYFHNQFAHAWYKLTTRDMGPRTRCSNRESAPPAQPWQYPLPSATFNSNFDVDQVRRSLKTLFSDEEKYINIGLLTRLGWQCISTFRSTDHLGGCNGARIRFSPGKDWPVNVNLDKALDLLDPIKNQFGDELSWADLIILAANTALEAASDDSISLSFCPGRVDDKDGRGWEHLQPRIMGNFSETLITLKDYISVMGISQKQFAALVGAGYAVGGTDNCRGLYCKRLTKTSGDLMNKNLSNAFFTDLLDNTWEEIEVNSIKLYKAKDRTLFMYKTDIMFKFDAELLAISQEFAADNQLFLDQFSEAWTLLANADRFDGPRNNICSRQRKPKKLT